MKKKKVIEVFLGNTDKSDPHIMLRVLRVPQGQLTVRTPYNAPDHWLAVREALDTIGVRLGARAKLCVERLIEDQEFLEIEGEKVSLAELCHIAQFKLKTSRSFRKRLSRNRCASRRELLTDKVDRFIVDNWRWLTTIKNPKYERGSPGLYSFRPAKAFELMNDEGVLPARRQHYDSAWVLWYKQRRRRLGRKLSLT